MFINSKPDYPFGNGVPCEMGAELGEVVINVIGAKELRLRV